MKKGFGIAFCLVFLVSIFGVYAVSDISSSYSRNIQMTVPETGMVVANVSFLDDSQLNLLTNQLKVESSLESYSLVDGTLYLSFKRDANVAGVEISNKGLRVDPLPDSYIVEFKGTPLVSNSNPGANSLVASGSAKERLVREHSAAIADINRRIIDSEIMASPPSESIFSRVWYSIVLFAKGLFGKEVSASPIDIREEYYNVFNGISINMDARQADFVKQSSYVKAIYPNRKVQANLMDSVPLINADDAWNLNDASGNRITGKNVTIAVIDTGVDYTHPDLGGCLGKDENQGSSGGGGSGGSLSASPVEIESRGNSYLVGSNVANATLSCNGSDVVVGAKNRNDVTVFLKQIWCASDSLTANTSAKRFVNSDVAWDNITCNSDEVVCGMKNRVEDGQRIHKLSCCKSNGVVNLTGKRLVDSAVVGGDVNCNNNEVACGARYYQDSGLDMLYCCKYTLNSYCGDGSCNSSIGENCSSCTQDCGPCPPPPSFTCSDSDGGINYSVRGSVVSDINRTDFCLPSSGDLEEYYCNFSSQQVGNTQYTCPNGCLDGACISGTVNCNSDLDCPITNIMPWCNGTRACSKDPRCLNPGTTSSSCTSVDSCINCDNGCSGGMCNVTTSPICNDSDGDNIFVKGNVSYNGSSYTDLCLVSAPGDPLSSVREFTCDIPADNSGSSGIIVGNVYYGNVYCPSGYNCSNGACVEVPDTQCKVIGGYDFINNDADPMDDNGHGTHVASTAAGKAREGAQQTYGYVEGSYVAEENDAGEHNYIIVSNGDDSDYTHIFRISRLVYDPSTSSPRDALTLVDIDSGLTYSKTDKNFTSGEIFSIEGRDYYARARIVNGVEEMALTWGSGASFGNAGSFISSLIVRRDSGASGLNGVAPDAKILAYKVLDSEGRGFWDQVLGGIETAVDPNGDGNLEDRADVISMSLGGWGDPDDPISRAIDKAVNLGVVAVIAAGNDYSYRSIGSPGTARNAITVGAVYKKDYDMDMWDNMPRKDEITSFSSKGPVEWSGGALVKPDVVAPGALICAARYDSIFPEGEHDFYKPCIDEEHVLLAGTSMATPIVSGAAALIRQAHPEYTPEEVKMALKSTAKVLANPYEVEGYQNVNGNYDAFVQGAGRIDVEKAINSEIIAYDLDFGMISQSSTKQLRIKNLLDTSLVLNIRAEDARALINKTFSSASLDIPSSIVLAPGETKLVDVAVNLDGSESGIYAGRIYLESPSSNYSVVYSFSVYATLTLNIEGRYPEFIIAKEDFSQAYSFSSGWDFEGSGGSILVEPGNYYVYALSSFVVADSAYKLFYPEEVEYVIGDKISLGAGEHVVKNYDVADYRKFTIKARDKDNGKLNLGMFNRAFTICNTEARRCYSSSSTNTLSEEGDKEIYISNSIPGVFNDLHYDYSGAPSGFTSGDAFMDYVNAKEEYNAAFFLSNISDSTPTLLDYNKSDAMILNYNYNYLSIEPQRFGATLWSHSPNSIYGGGGGIGLGLSVSPQNKKVYFYAQNLSSNYREGRTYSREAQINYFYSPDDNLQWLYEIGASEETDNIYYEKGKVKNVSFGGPYLPTSFGLDYSSGDEPYLHFRNNLLSGKEGNSNFIRWCFSGAGCLFDNPRVQISHNGEVHEDYVNWRQNNEPKFYFMTGLEGNWDANLTFSTQYPLYNNTIVSVKYNLNSSIPGVGLPWLSSLSFPTSFYEGENLSIAVGAGDYNLIPDVQAYYRIDGGSWNKISWRSGGGGGSDGVVSVGVSGNITASGNSIDLKVRLNNSAGSSQEYYLSPVSLKKEAMSIVFKADKTSVNVGDEVNIWGEVVSSSAKDYVIRQANKLLIDGKAVKLRGLEGETASICVDDSCAIMTIGESRMIGGLDITLKNTSEVYANYMGRGAQIELANPYPGGLTIDCYNGENKIGSAVSDGYELYGGSGFTNLGMFSMKFAAALPGNLNLSCRFAGTGSYPKTISQKAVAGARDIAISGIEKPSAISVGTPATIVVKVKNLGSQTEEDINVDFSYLDFSGNVQSGDSQNIGRLNPGEEREVSFVFDYPESLDALAWYKGFKFNISKLSGETSIFDNSRLVPFLFFVPVSTAEGETDIRVWASINNYNVALGENQLITAYVYNDGDRIVENVSLKFYVGKCEREEECNFVLAGQREISTLYDYTSRPFSYNFSEYGPYIIKMTVETPGDVNPDNDFGMIWVYVVESGADLSGGIYVDNEVVGKPSNVSINLHNSGIEASRDTSYALYYQKGYCSLEDSPDHCEDLSLIGGGSEDVGVWGSVSKTFSFVANESGYYTFVGVINASNDVKLENNLLLRNIEFYTLKNVSFRVVNSSNDPVMRTIHLRDIEPNDPAYSTIPSPVKVEMPNKSIQDSLILADWFRGAPQTEDDVEGLVSVWFGASIADSVNITSEIYSNLSQDNNTYYLIMANKPSFAYDATVMVMMRLNNSYLANMGIDTSNINKYKPFYCADFNYSNKKCNGNWAIADHSNIGNFSDGLYVSLEYSGKADAIALAEGACTASESSIQCSGGAEISFLGNVDLSRIKSNPELLRQYVTVVSTDSEKSISVNTTMLPELNVSAEIYFSDVMFSNPTILLDGQACPDSVCSIREYNTAKHIIIFNVTHFSKYSVVEGFHCGDGSCNNGETCSSCVADCGACNKGGGSGGGSGGGFAPRVSCSANWSCNWGVCASNLQRWVCVDKNGCGNLTGKPEEITKTCLVNGDCVDGDGDGYGIGNDCLGADLNDNDPGVTNFVPQSDANVLEPNYLLIGVLVLVIIGIVVVILVVRKKPAVHNLEADFKKVKEKKDFKLHDFIQKPENRFKQDS